LQNDVVAEVAVLADNGMGVGKQIVPRRGMGVKDDVRENDGVVADGDVVADNGIGANMGVVPDTGGGGDGGRGMNARDVGRRPVEQFDCEGEGQVGIFHAEGRGRHLGKTWFNQDSRGSGGAGEGGVLGV
jgi:hypothetical protein